ncbi:MAG: hypothetical protein HRT34_06640, partial [Alcanivorax sp.]|nr:hypothetical protein [Alcanivorax sp.]
SDGTRIVDARQQYDAPEVWPIYTHPAPQVAGLTETAIKSSPAYRALHREKEHLLGLLKDQAPQVAVPEAITKYDGYVPPEDGSAGEYYVDGWNSCRDAILANSAPAQTVSASVPEQKTWNQAGGREDLRYTEGWNDCRAAMLAAAPAAPAGELVTRCTAGLGCDEKGYCDAAATGQGDMCDRRTMAHEQPVSDPDGLPEPGRREAEQAYINGAFDYARDPIGSRDWVLFWNGWQARDKSAPSPDEREIAAQALDDFMFDVAERVRLLSGSDQEARVLRKVNGWLHSRAKRLRAGKEGQ